ncbi:MAG: Smr/MutS family protein, partial [Verrucomicrobia bacterium]|nr:Smr/MutS family protein [Verrucomicrobiota bacterium]
AEVLPHAEPEPLPPDLTPIEDWSLVAVGEAIFLRDFRETAILMEKPDHRSRVKVQLREKKMTVPEAQCLRRITQTPPPASVEKNAYGGAIVISEEAEGNLLRLDLRGQMADDALLETEQFLDQAVRLNIPSIAVIHGHGTGVLKRTIRQYLKSSPYAKSWRPGKQGEGGDGVTIVDLDL